MQFMFYKGMLLGSVLAGVLMTRAEVDVSKLPAASPRQDVTFEKDIKPLFEKSCFKCHGEEKPKAKLRVDSIEAIKKGSSSGEVVVVGKSEKSSLVHSISMLDPDLAMPPEGKGDPLTKEQVALVRAWIDQGLK
jgi:hypothetical protein